MCFKHSIECSFIYTFLEPNSSEQLQTVQNTSIHPGANRAACKPRCNPEVASGRTGTAPQSYNQHGAHNPQVENVKRGLESHGFDICAEAQKKAPCTRVRYSSLGGFGEESGLGQEGSSIVGPAALPGRELHRIRLYINNWFPDPKWLSLNKSCKRNKQPLEKTLVTLSPPANYKMPTTLKRDILDEQG